MSRGALGSGSILRRRPPTSTSTLRSNGSSGRLATASRSASRLNTLPGRLTKTRSSANSPRVSAIGSPDSWASVQASRSRTSPANRTGDLASLESFMPSLSPGSGMSRMARPPTLLLCICYTQDQLLHTRFRQLHVCYAGAICCLPRFATFPASPAFPRARSTGNEDETDVCNRCRRRRDRHAGDRRVGHSAGGGTSGQQDEADRRREKSWSVQERSLRPNAMRKTRSTSSWARRPQAKSAAPSQASSSWPARECRMRDGQYVKVGCARQAAQTD